MVTSPPTASRRRSSLLPFRPQTSQGLQSHLPPSTSHSNVPPLPRSPSIEALRRLDQAFDQINQKRGFEPGSSRWSTHFSMPRHVYAVDTPEESLNGNLSQGESSQAPVYAQFQPHSRLPIHGHASHLSTSGHSRRESTSTTQLSTGFLSQARSLVRRASTTLSGQPSYKLRRGSNTNNQRLEIPEEAESSSSSSSSSAAILEAPYPLQRPSTAYPDYQAGTSSQHKPQTTKRASFLKRMRSFRSRRDAASTQQAQTYPESTFPYHLSANQSYPEPQVHQFDWPRPGAAARASAAAAASTSTMHLASNLPAAGGRPSMLTRKDTKCSRSTRTTSSTDFVETAKRADTAMEVDSVMEPAEKRSDPLERLPPELVSQIFTYLDFQSLARASVVSTAWHQQLHPTKCQLWREVFLRRYRPRHTMNPIPLQMGGAGIGAPGRQPRDWYRMCQTRVEIDRNWKRGDAAAIYFQGHTDSVYCAQFDEKKIITGSRDRTIRVWDLESMQCIRVIGGPNAKPAPPRADEPILECHPNTIVRGTNLNGTEAGDALFHQPTYYHEASVLCLQFDNEILVTGSSDSSCIVWDINTWQPIRRLDHHNAGVLDVCFDNRFIISCSKDNKICVWRRSDGELLKVLEGHRGPVNAVQMRGDLLVSASGDGMSKLWCLQKFECIRDYQSKDRGLAAVEFSDDARFILAGGNDQVIYKYDTATAELVHTYAGHQGLVRSLFLDSQNNRVVSGSYDQAMRVYDFASGASLGGDPGPRPLGATNGGAAAFLENNNGVSPTGAYENWTTSWILSAKSDYRRIVATSQDGRALLMDFGHGVDPHGLRLLAGS